MNILHDFLRKLPEYQTMRVAIDAAACPLAVSGFSATARAFFAAGLQEDTGRPVILLCADDSEAQKLLGDLESLTGEVPLFLPPRDFSFHPGTAGRQWEQRRLGVFSALREENTAFLVVTVEALLQRTLPVEAFEAACRTLQSDGSYPLTELVTHLSSIGYSRTEQVEAPGQFALRGGILDLFSSNWAQPLRVEFWGDEIDSMGFFDPLTQRRTEPATGVTILPAGEVIGISSDQAGIPPDCLLPRLYSSLATAADYLPEDALLLFCESSRVSDRGRSWLWQLEEDVKTLIEEGTLPGENAIFSRSLEDLYQLLSNWPVLFLDAFTAASFPLPPKKLLSVQLKQLPGYGMSLDATREDLLHYRRDGFAVVLLAPSKKRAEHLLTLLEESQIHATLDLSLSTLPGAGDIVITQGSLSAGLEFTDGRFVILAEGSSPSPRQKRRVHSSSRQKLESFTDLNQGDLVVHEHHGVGRFEGLVKMPVDGTTRDYVKLQFSGADVLYVPATQLDLVSKYIGGGEDGPQRRLSKLGGAEWEKSKSRAKGAAKELAKGLIQLYAQRQRQPGFAFSPDSPWQKEFEEQFEYEETDDQLRCIQEIKGDMERSTPMDRLLCGDVGYGKTEVAFRAIMKCVLDGKQAAILAPTTVLAQQHFLTATRRFSNFPVTIEMVSRFRTAAQSRDILARTAQGSIDLLIGTHKLLAKGMEFQNLGLLVVDEEQRFGVGHKERLKEMAKQVDVLVLSATPIPRTLNMALSGLRDMSILEEPPQNRRPVQTYVMEHQWPILSDAMRRELERGGQVYYLHNRVETIESCASRVRGLLPDARIALAHGRMEQEELSEIMRQMRDNEVDILICTTIIETGVDLPNVNTLIVEDADKLGLSQLHQLRGRVGRSSRRASAYMTYRRGKILTEVASRRLSAIREFAAFGSGFKIAMRDLEIRGAGNLLGPEQSGFLMTVGYDMYLRLLEEAVLEEQGLPVARAAECLAELSVPASISDSYIPSPQQRMEFYRRIAQVRTEEAADEIMDEIIDRYGDPPRSVNNLVSIALLRTQASLLGITELSQKDTLLRFFLPTPDFARISALCGQEKYRQRLLFSAGDKPHLAFRLRKGDDILRLARIVLDDFAASPETALP